ncbi:hypothetical protein EVAR_99918_1, partial [Eumeta japonica]
MYAKTFKATPSKNLGYGGCGLLQDTALSPYQ